jgi:hypothetical protein
VGGDSEEEDELELQPKVVYSLQSARPGDLLSLDRQGRVRSRAEVRRTTAFGVFRLGLVGGFVGLLWAGLAGSAVAGIVAGAATSALLLLRARRTRRALTRASGLLASARLTEARVAIEALSRRALDAGSRFARDYLDYLADWMMGERASALAKCQRLHQGSPGRGRVTCDRVWLLAVAGRGQEARAAFESAPRLTQGEWAGLRRVGAELRLAFLEDELPSTFDNERLHHWARAVLATSLFGPLCALLAWAFDKRGDAEMAEHMLEETPARLGRSSLEHLDPPLAAWVAGAARRQRSRP